MKMFKNAIDDAVEYKNQIAKLNKNGQLIDIEPMEMVKVITISLEEYKELLICKGKCEELKESKEKIVDYLLEHYKKGDISPNEIRELLGYKKRGK